MDMSYQHISAGIYHLATDDAPRIVRGWFGDARTILDDHEIDYTAADVIALAKLIASDFHSSLVKISSQNMEEKVETLASCISEGLNNIAISIEK